uniref:CCHC-type domain-containing protein n=1 Tax=Tanacetum cinerariifolium TaxID=118510 RepID=A0A6L2KG52_TANCI|nr:hypothetical protein [Tanacetum cinerariifolium]
MNMSPENKAHFQAEKEVIHLILTGIGDEIYSAVDASQTAQEMWEAIERLQQEWSRFVTIVKQQHKLDEVSYHKLFDILKQYQKEVNELRTERLARNANPLALVSTAQANQEPYYQTSKSHKSYAPSLKPSIPTRSHTTTRHKGKEIAKPMTPPSETTSEEDSDPEQAQRDKDMQKNLDLTAKYFKKIYKPTNNNLRTSSNSRNKNVDTTPWENVGSLVVQQSGIQCFNCKEFGHFAKECRKPKRVKDSAYHKEKMLLCKQAEQGVLFQAEQYDWLADTYEEINEQELKAHYSYMDKIQENDQNDVESDDERVTLANLIANLKLDVDENKKFKKTSKSLGESISVWDSCLVALQNKQTEFEKYKPFNDCTIDYDKLERKLNEALGQLAQNDIEIKEGLVKQKTKVITDLKLREEHDIDKILSMEIQLNFLNEIVYKRSQSIQTIHMMAPKVPTYNGRPTFANPRYLKQAQSEIPCLYAFPYDQSTHANILITDEEETLALEREKIVDNAWIKHSKDQFRAPTAQDIEILIQTCLMPLAIKTQNDSFLFVHELKKERNADLKYVESLEKEIDKLEYDKAEFSNMYDMILQECVSKDVMCSYLLLLSDLDALDECNVYISIKSKNVTILHKSFRSKRTLELKKLIEKGKGKSMDTMFDKPSVVRQPKPQRIPKPSVLEVLSKPVTAETLPHTARQAVSNTNVLRPGMYRIDNGSTQTRTPQLPQTVRNTNPRVSTTTGVNHNTNVSRPQHKSNQLKDKVMPNNHQVKLKTQVEVHPRIHSVSNKM